MIEPLRIFVGYDESEAVAYHVCCQSLIASSSRPLEIHPLALHLFDSAYKEKHEDGSNEFIYSRFLVPWLCKWDGFAIYMDSDMLVRDDIADLWNRRSSFQGCAVVKHDYRTKHAVKYRGNPNEDYPRKNWSSLILWNCGYFPNRALTPEYVGKQTGSHLHRFEWLKDSEIDTLPAHWNHLVGEYEPSDAAKVLHFTLGIPAFEGYQQQEGAQEWRDDLTAALVPMKSDGFGNYHISRVADRS